MLSKIKDAFINKKIDKSEYIDSMYKQHQILFEYSDYLRNTPVSKIEILSGEGVVFTIAHEEIKIFCDQNDKRTAPFEMMNFGKYEEQDSNMIYNLIENDYTVVDIGANIGWYSINIAQKLKSGRVISFEPVPETFARLKKNIEINNVKNIEYYNIGLSDKEGEATFYLSPFTSVSGSATNISQEKDVRKIVCKLSKIDTFFKGYTGSIDFIKCDVEGAELFVFKGGLNTIKQHAPVIFAEMLRKWSALFNYHPNEIIHLLKGLGYNCFSVDGDKLKIVEQVVESTVETNFFFLHIEKHKDIISKHRIK